MVKTGKKTAKRGRPRLPKGEGKRFPINTRTTKELKERIDSAAHESGRSVSQEIEYRLERSFMIEGGLGMVGIDPKTAQLIKDLLDVKSLLENKLKGGVWKHWDWYRIWARAVERILNFPTSTENTLSMSKEFDKAVRGKKLMAYQNHMADMSLAAASTILHARTEALLTRLSDENVPKDDLDFIKSEFLSIPGFMSENEALNQAYEIAKSERLTEEKLQEQRLEKEEKRKLDEALDLAHEYELSKRKGK